MPRNARGRASAALTHATNESNFERANIAARGGGGAAAGPAGAGAVPPAAGFAVVIPAVAAAVALAPIVPAAAAAAAAGGPAAAPAGPAAAPAGPVAALPPLPAGVVVPATMQRVPIVVGPPSLHGPGQANGTAGGPLSAFECRRNAPYGLPIASGGPPTTIRIHLITSENHLGDAVCGGWLLRAGTYLQTLVIHAHTIAELNLRSRPNLLWELGLPRRIAHFYMLTAVNSWTHIANDAANDIWVGVHIISDYHGSKMSDVDLELEPPGQVPIAGVAGSGAGRGGAAAGSGVGAGRGASRGVGSASGIGRGGSSAGRAGAGAGSSAGRARAAAGSGVGAGRGTGSSVGRGVFGAGRAGVSAGRAAGLGVGRGTGRGMTTAGSGAGPSSGR